MTHPTMMRKIAGSTARLSNEPNRVRSNRAHDPMATSTTPPTLTIQKFAQMLNRVSDGGGE